MDFATVEQVKGYLGINTFADDALFSRLIAEASTYIRSWLNRDISQATYTDSVNGNGSASLTLANYPVQSVASVMIDGQSIPPAALVTDMGYIIDDFGIALRGYKFCKGVRNVSVTYTAGFTAVPADITQACIEMVSMRYKERDRIGHVSKGLAGETVTYSQKDMADSTKTLLQQYKKVVPT